MKYLNSLIFLLNFLAFGVAAQELPPPPPPLIYKAPESSVLKEFVDEDRFFQIVFPGTPKIEKQQNASGAAVSYVVYRVGSNSVVSTGDFNLDLEENKEKVYSLIKDNLLKTPNSKIQAERDVQISGISGKEFEILYKYQYQRVRILIVGKRIYEIKVDVTNWHIISDKTKKEFFAETDRFFNSFKLLK